MHTVRDLLLDATLDDLGAGMRWEEIHRVRPRAPLVCPACGTGMHAKVSPHGLRFFAHDSAVPHCPNHGETVEHHRLKHDLAKAVRAAGWRATVEAQGDGWRADVLATSPDGRRRMAWEAQLSQITLDELLDRTAAYVASGVGVCWVAVGTPHWFGQVPVVQLSPRRAGGWAVTDGYRRLLGDRALSRLWAVNPWRLETEDLVGEPTWAWEERIGAQVWRHWLVWPDVLCGARDVGVGSGGLAGSGGVPQALRLRGLISWGRVWSPLPLRTFVRLIGQAVPVELVLPHRDLQTPGRQEARIVWTAAADLDRAGKLTAFALGWPLTGRGVGCDCDQCGCGRGVCFVLDAGWMAEVHLCAACDGDLVEVVVGVCDFESCHIGESGAPARLRAPDSWALIYQPPPKPNPFGME